MFLIIKYIEKKQIYSNCKFKFLLQFQLNPAKGNVAFGSGLHGWGFNLDQFAQMYTNRFKVKKEKMVRKLWGNNFYNPQEKKWSETPSSCSERGFCKFVLDPVIKVGNLSYSGIISY